MLDEAERLGRLLAEAGFDVLNGGSARWKRSAAAHGRPAPRASSA